MDKEIPAIRIFFNQNIEEAKFREILYGIEEETVPFIAEKTDKDSALHLGYQAAQSSRLGVGMGIGNDQLAVLHYERLKEDKPLFQINLNDHPVNLRVLGSNAARLVKGMPFKDFRDKHMLMPEQSKKVEEELAREKIVSIIKKVLSEVND
ncbi:glycerol dehydratase reactivase beta/small subunit family protein [Thermoactinomyces mirandus]|nr:glycerol dehydratase reactivase beta/small subunit family protein [Thermoactinomyces mirandus]